MNEPKKRGPKPKHGERPKQHHITLRVELDAAVKAVANNNFQGYIVRLLEAQPEIAEALRRSSNESTEIDQSTRHE